MENKANLSDIPKDDGPRRIQAISGLLIFNYSNEEFCIDLECLNEVRNIDETIINVKKNREAVIFLDKHEYKLIQLHKILGYLKLTTSPGNRIIFIEIFNKKIAFMVERINEILTTEFLLVEDNLSMEIKALKKYIKSVIKFQGRSIFTLDFEKICKELDHLTTVSGIKDNSGKYRFT